MGTAIRTTSFKYQHAASGDMVSEQQRFRWRRGRANSSSQLGIGGCGGFQSGQSSRLCPVRHHYASDSNLVFVGTNLHWRRLWANPSGVWELVATADFNADSHPDYVLYNASTHQKARWYLNNNVFAGGAFGPTLPVNWSLVGVADFDREGHKIICCSIPVITKQRSGIYQDQHSSEALMGRPFPVGGR